MNYELKQFLKKFFGSRLFVLAAVISLFFLLVLIRVFSLQIVNGKEYQKNFTLLIQKTLSIDAARGNIYDCNGNLLAYNELAYSVVISDNGSYNNTSVKNEELNAELAEIISVIRKNGENIYNDFAIKLNDDGKYEYSVSGTSLNRFLADVFGEVSYDKLEYNKKFDFDESKATAEQVMQYLMSDENECFDVSDEYDKETAYEIVVLRYAIKGNRYSKYKTTTIAKDVSDKTVAYMNEHSDTLTGVSIEEDTIRKYNYSEYISSLIGYTGKISTEEYNELSEKDESYTTNDTVGKSGLEQYYESYLRGVNGEQEIYVNSVGKITEVISSTDPTAGNDLYLSIDINLQEATYKLLEQEIAGIVYSKIKSGDIPVNDVYFALLNNNIINISDFEEDDAGETERAVQSVFLSNQANVINQIDSQLNSDSALAIENMPEDILDYFTYIFSMLKEDGVLVSSKIDTSDSTYQEWKNEKLSPREYLKYCISQQWIDITRLEVDEKYADSAEIFKALCQYIQNEIKTDKEFSKLIYKYLVQNGSISGQQLCLIMFEQGAVDYDDDIVSGLKSGATTAYSFLMDKINNIEITPAQLALDPCTGSKVITDVNTGEIKALVSYPGYDNNKLANGVDAEYYAFLQEDNSNPLYNYATQEKTAPGSTFKMITSTAGLAENVITTSTTIQCTGKFYDVSNEPECWIYPGNHGFINVSEAIRDSCNVFFYTTGFNLAAKDTGTYDDANGISYIQKYASIYGLNQKTGIEIEENTPEIATQYPVMAAIGQSDNNFTTVSLSRYVTAVTSGKLYDYQLMSRIVDTEGNIVASYEPHYTDITDTLNSGQWDAIHSGMRMVVENLDSFAGFEIPVAGKTGTAQQVETRPNHALFVGYFPYDDPKYSIATRIAYGYSSHNAASAARNIISYYYGNQALDDILELDAEGVNTSASSERTD